MVLADHAGSRCSCVFVVEQDRATRGSGAHRTALREDRGGGGCVDGDPARQDRKLMACRGSAPRSAGCRVCSWRTFDRDGERVSQFAVLVLHLGAVRWWSSAGLGSIPAAVPGALTALAHQLLPDPRTCWNNAAARLRAELQPHPIPSIGIYRVPPLVIVMVLRPQGSVGRSSEAGARAGRRGIAAERAGLAEPSQLAAKHWGRPRLFRAGPAVMSMPHDPDRRSTAGRRRQDPPRRS